MGFTVIIRPCPFDSADFQTACCGATKTYNELLAGSGWRDEITKAMRNTRCTTIVYT
jgi:hypothetical protein